MNFVAIDVETANPDLASICQVGAVRVSAGEIVDGWSSYIDPQDFFCPTNVAIHGISKRTVKGAPNWKHAAESLRDFAQADVIVSHTHFDRSSIRQACEQHGAAPFDCTWIDSARVARRVWPQFARKGFGLANLCQFIEYEFQHHDALEDAKAAAEIMRAALSHDGSTIEDWLARIMHQRHSDVA